MGEDHRRSGGTVVRRAAVARDSDPLTSWDAARSLGELTQRQADVLAELRAWGPMTDERLVTLVRDQSPSGVRTRRSELVAAGLVVDSGERVESPNSHRKMIVWKVADEPVAPLEQLTAFEL